MNNTRTVRLWLGNDEALYRTVQVLAGIALEDAAENETHGPTARNTACDDLAAGLRQLVEDSSPVAAGMWQDLIASALDSIDFDEIAKELLDDLELFAVFSSDDEDAVLFTEMDLAKEFLEEKLDNDNTMHAGLFMKLHGLEVGESIEIEGTTYTLEKA